jgi:hypothetical protein
MNLKSRRFWMNATVVASLLAGFAVVGNAAQQARVSVETGVRPLGMTTAGGDGGEQVTAIDLAASADVSGPFVGEEVKAVSMDLALTDLPQDGFTADQRVQRSEPLGPIDPSASFSSKTDPVAQTRFGRISIPAPINTFAGLDLTNWGAGWPPDTHGAVGPNHYIQAVNSSVAIYDKATGSRLAAFKLDAFFPAGNACDTNNQGDPIVLFDQWSGRFMVTDFNWASTNGPFYECIAVAKTSDPVNGGWWSYAVQVSSSNMGDYPKFGAWHDGIYMGANMFKRARTYAEARVWAFNRADLISGAPLRSVSFSLGSSQFSVFPANAGIATALPAAGTPAFFFSNYGTTTALKVWKMTTNWTTPSASTISAVINVPVASYTKPSSKVPQLGSTVTLDTLGDRIMSAPEYVNIGGTPAIWVNHTVVSGSATGIRWYELRNLSGTPSVYQQGTYQPDSNYRWMGSLAVDKQGNMAVGYSVSSSSMYPAIRYAGRLTTDTLGALGQGEATLYAGTGAQTSYSRWGDYATMTVDPNDGCTFWYSTEFYSATGTNWQTRIGSFKFAGCN